MEKINTWRLAVKKLVLVLVALLLSSTSFAQYESSNIDFDMPIDIDGTYSAPTQGKQLTSAQRLKLFREQLEKRNEIMVKKKIETLRYKQELEMMKKIQNAFNQSMQNINNIQ